MNGNLMEPLLEEAEKASISLKLLARILGVTPPTLAAWVRAGKPAEGNLRRVEVCTQMLNTLRESGLLPRSAIDLQWYGLVSLTENVTIPYDPDFEFLEGPASR